MTATIPAVESEATTIEHLDFEYVPPCESNHAMPWTGECQGAASWGHTAPCGCFRLVCDRLREGVLDRIKVCPLGKVYCGECNSVPVTWAEWGSQVKWRSLR